MKNDCLFVYGTLRGDAGHEMYRVLAADAHLVGSASARGELYSLGEYPGFVSRPDSSDRVSGELYEFKTGRAAQALRLLDDYEGIGEHHPRPHEYRREQLPVIVNDGRQVRAWVYVLNRSPEGLERIRSGDFTEWRKSRSA